MKFIQIILRHLQHSSMDGEIEEELRYHIEMRTRDNIIAGMSPAEAAADAERRFGDFDQVKSECRQIESEKQWGVMNLNVMKSLALMMFGCGLTLNLSSSIHSLQQVGSSLMVIAVLWRLYLRFRAAEPDQHRINQHLRAAEHAPLGIGVLLESPNVETPDLQFAPSEGAGSTPVGRLISDRESLASTSTAKKNHE
ncbi:MAG: hypothetical protein JST85_14055 [Acidobacteria bacterium]|nr:hypothetical protein [Acidobacteriota bacterium]